MAIDIVQVILESVLLRREKNMKDKNGNSILALPPKTVRASKLRKQKIESLIHSRLP